MNFIQGDSVPGLDSASTNTVPSDVRGSFAAADANPESAPVDRLRCVTIRGALDAARFELSLRQALRECVAQPTCDASGTDERGWSSWRLRRIDCSDCADAKAMADAWMRTGLRASADLAGEAPLCFALARTGEDTHRFYLGLNSLVTNALFDTVLANLPARLETIYAASMSRAKQEGATFDAPRSVPLPEPPASVSFPQPSDEWNRVVVEWNDTKRHVLKIMTPALFEAQASRTPDAVAVADEHSTWDYATLNARANRLAHRLIRLGLGPESLVAVCLPHSAEHVAVLLAVLKAGAAYLSLDPHTAGARRQQVIDDARPRLIITRPPFLAEEWEDARTPLLVLDADDARVSSRVFSSPDPNDRQRSAPLASAHTAFVSYASDGLVRGVSVSHGSLVNVLLAACAELPLAPGRGLLSTLAPGNGAAGLEWLLPLVRGARLVFASSDASHDPAQIAGLIGRHRIDVMCAAPRFWAGLLESAPDSLREVHAIIDGDAPPQGIAQRVAAATGRPVATLYGAAETGYWAISGRVDADASDTVATGRPLWNMQAYVLDAALRPSPVGAVGDLYLAGTGLARGYRHRPGLTAERFVACPFGTDGARMYRTGERARWRQDGVLERLGRVQEPADRIASPRTVHRDAARNNDGAPRTHLEGMLARLFAQSLGREQVRVDDNFFELGGHALMAAQLIKQLRDRIEVDLPLQTLSEAPTVAALARRLNLRSQPGATDSSR